MKSEKKEVTNLFGIDKTNDEIDDEESDRETARFKELEDKLELQEKENESN